MPTPVEKQIIAEVAERLSLPPAVVRVFSCPVCRQRRFAGMLGAGSVVKVRCARSSCAHHALAMPWVVSASGMDSNERLRIHRCPSPVCENPCITRAPYMHSENVKYDNGRPVCNWTWSCAYLAPGTKLIVWCKESSCLNYKRGFKVISQ